MLTRVALATTMILAAGELGAQNAPPPLIGRWDLRIAAPGGDAAGWLEVERSGNSTLVGRTMISVGSARRRCRRRCAATSPG